MAILSIPSAHPYVQSIQPRGGWSFTHVLPDPVVNPDKPDQWWPHPAFHAHWWLDRERIGTSERIDLVHVHFGFEHLTVHQTRDFVELLRMRRIPLVLTVHDIDNPHVVDQQAFHAQLRILSDDAARILTLTEAARVRLTRDFGIDPQRITVVPHPRIIEDPQSVVAAQMGTDIGIFLKSVRANVVTDADFYIRIAERCVEKGRRVTVFLHRDQEGTVLHRLLSDSPAVHLVLHEPFSDATLFSTVAECSAVILPYLRGTHSGWLEMCRDLGVPVAYPDCGCYFSQLDDSSAGESYRVADACSAADAAVRLASAGSAPLAVDRQAQRSFVLDVHEQIYRAMSTPKLNIALIAPARFPIAQPYAGGLEAFCAMMVQAYRHFGHRVDLYAAAGSDGHQREWQFPGVNWSGYEKFRTDHTYPPGEMDREDAAFARTIAHLQQPDEAGVYDVIHNNCLHPAPFQTKRPLPMLTTIHTPVDERMQNAISTAVSERGSRGAGAFASVSRAASSTWDLPEEPIVVSNGFDENIWMPGAGGERAVWFGRVVPEKGLHFAIDAARELGLELDIAGRIGNESYYEEEILPRLGSDTHWVGESSQETLSALVGGSKLCLVTPVWDEPFGLVVVEALACGTPVAALARGGIAEILADFPQALVSPANPVAELVRAARYVISFRREDWAQWSRQNFSGRRLANIYTEILDTVAFSSQVTQ